MGRVLLAASLGMVTGMCAGGTVVLVLSGVLSDTYDVVATGLGGVVSCLVAFLATRALLRG